MIEINFFYFCLWDTVHCGQVKGNTNKQTTNMVVFIAVVVVIVDCLTDCVVGCSIVNVYKRQLKVSFKRN